jgi:S-adenosylmethionine synthetase
VTHVGKLYQIAAQRIAEGLLAEIAHATDVECYLVSQIGRPIIDPQIANVKLGLAGGSAADHHVHVETVVVRELGRLEHLWREALGGALSIF